MAKKHALSRLVHALNTLSKKGIESKEKVSLLQRVESDLKKELSRIHKQQNQQKNE
jgi:hypothetical protein